MKARHEFQSEEDYLIYLREYFAAMADLEEWKDSSVQFMESVVGEVVPDWSKEPLAHLTFHAKFHAIIKRIKADALITELNKQQ